MIRQLGGGGVKIEGRREERERDGDKERNVEEGKKGRRGKGRKERKGEGGRGGRKEKKKLIQDAKHQNTQCHENSLAVECSASSDCYPQTCPAHDTRRLPWHRLGCVVSAREPASVLPAPAECDHRGSLAGGCQHKAQGSGAPG